MTRNRPRRRPRTFNQKFWEDPSGNFVVWQSPNIYLKMWFIATVLSWFTPHGFITQALGLVGLATIIIWAGLEAWNGVNYFRRLIGWLVILLLLLPRVL